MGAIFDFINKPLGMLMRVFAQAFGGNFAMSVFIFTLLIDIILIPLSIKSQKSTVAQMRIKPKLDELKKRYGDDKQKMAQAQQELYQKENVSMAGGCLPMLIRLIVLFAIYNLILSPLTYMSGADKTKVANFKAAVDSGMSVIEKNDEARYKEISEQFSWSKSSNNDLVIIKLVRDDSGVAEEIIGKANLKKVKDSDKKQAYKNKDEVLKDLEAIRKKDKEAGINYTLFSKKVDLTETPDFSMDIFHKFQLNWLLPFGAFLAQILMSLISMKINKINNPDAPSMMAMMLLMPLISLFIGFGFPGGVCFYWICSSIVGGLVQVFVQIFYGPQKLLARERTKDLVKQCDFEAKQLEHFGSKLN